MNLAVQIKDKAPLSEEEWQREVDCRRLLLTLDTREVEILTEIVDGSPNFSVQALADTAHVSVKSVIDLLDKLVPAGLLKYSDDFAQVNKEMRKNFELHLQAFQEDFSPDISYAISLFKNKVPLHVLANWYTTNCLADYLIDSIVERYFQTPEVYTRYLQEIQWEDPFLEEVRQHTLTHPGSEIDADLLCQKHELTIDEFLERALILEYHLVGFVYFPMVGSKRARKILPLTEWRNYLTRQRAVAAAPIKDPSVMDKEEQPFSFIEQLHAHLSAKVIDPSHPLAETAVAYQFVSAGRLTDLAKEWMGLSNEEKALFLYRISLKSMEKRDRHPQLYTEVNACMVERGLKTFIHFGWVSFNDFFKAQVSPIAGKSSVSLERKGKRWRYVFPEYSEVEKEFIHDIIFERLYQAGFVEHAMFGDEQIFRVTSFGASILS